MHVEAEEGTVVVRLGQDFVVPDTRRLITILESVPPYSELIVDFTDTCDFPDLSFPSFLQAIKRTTGTRRCVSLRGLTAHQSRLLRYLGLLR